MGLVDSWLEGIGLAYAVPVFSAQGINSPDLLSELDVVDFPELGITDQNDRKKLFYLIQRVRLALDRGRAADSKAAPQADSAVSSTTVTTTVTAERAHVSKTTATTSARLVTREATPAGDNAACSGPVRFRSELEVPARCGDTAASRGSEGDRRTMMPPDSGTTGGGGGGGGGGGAAGVRQTPVKVQRPTSYRRPKTPHIEATQRQSSASNVLSSAPVGGEEGGRRAGARQQAAAENPRQPAASAAKASDAGAAATAVERATAVGRYRQDQLASGNGPAGKAAAPEQRPPPPPQQKYGNLADERSVLEPMQLDEAGGRARGASPRPRIPPPLSAQACGGQQVPQATSRGFDERQAVRDRTGSRAPDLLAPETADEVPHARRSYTMKRFSPDEDDDGVTAKSDEEINITAAAAAVGDKKVARLRRANRGEEAGTAATTTQAPAPAMMRGYGAPRENGEGGSPRAGNRASWQKSRAAEQAQEAAAEKAERQRETAAELAVHLISAHREDVRSALAAARKDMDLVSKADQDRHPAALLAYAREVEGVLGARLAAGAKLRAALDSYVALRQASSSPRRTETGAAGVGSVRTRGRAVHT